MRACVCVSVSARARVCALGGVRVCPRVCARAPACGFTASQISLNAHCCKAAARMQFDIDFVTAPQCWCAVVSLLLQTGARAVRPRPHFPVSNLLQDVHNVDHTAHLHRIVGTIIRSREMLLLCSLVASHNIYIYTHIYIHECLF